MYRAYAADPQMRVNVGIRRRLAPLMQNDRRKIELMNGLLFVAAGHAGHLLRRRARHGRQRLPRRPRRRAHADAVEPRPQRRLLRRQPAAALPAGDHRPRVPLRDRQRRGPGARTRTRCCGGCAGSSPCAPQHPVFGRGEIEFLYPENAKVLAFVRRDERRDRAWWWPTSPGSPPRVALDLHEYRGAGARRAVRWHRVRRRCSEGPYQLTLGPYGFYWFSLESQTAEPRLTRPIGGERPARCSPSPSDWQSLMQGTEPAPSSSGCCPGS